MLEPETRELLMDLLRPPEGMQMDIAVGTTYTLDLNALLLAPLSFAMFDWASDEHGGTDPLATLEALRRHADRTTLFCQDGMIGVPREYQGLMLHLEDAVVPVSAPRPHGIFHPKVWVVRYVAEDGERHWRVLILSRNLTFDASWDTVVVLDSVRVLEQHRPGGVIARFLKELVKLGGNRLDKRRRKDINALAEEIRHVRFAAPEGFDANSLWFLPYGLDISTDYSLPPSNISRTLVVSPFLGDEALRSMASAGPDNDIVVSRPETLDQLLPETLEGWDAYVLATGQVEDLVETPDDTEATSLRGLHAKLLIFERGDTASVISGSLNVTGAALSRNVELMAWMNGPVEKVGIGSFMGGTKHQRGPAVFGRMLEAYTPTHGSVDEEEAERELSRDLDRARIALSQLTMHARVELVSGNDSAIPGAVDDVRWRFALDVTGQAELPDAVTSVAVWRLTGPRVAALPLDLSVSSQTLDFGIVGEPSITAFFAVAVQAEKAGKRDEATFLVRAELDGAPEGRAERMLARSLASRDAVIRYLQFLLADGSEAMRELMQELGMNEHGTSGGNRTSGFGSGLMERLLDVLVSDPERLAHVDRLLRDLRDVDDGALLPEGFDAIWEAIDEVRRGLATTSSTRRKRKR